MKISVVIPCYGSEKTIEGVVKEAVDTINTRRGQYEYEVILVNDSSPDGVFEVIKRLAAEDPHIKGIELAKNFGQHAAIMAGLRFVSGDIIVCMDDDGQTPANEMFRLIDKLNEGYDLVMAKYSEKKHSFYRNAGSKLNDLMAKKMLNKPKGFVITSYFCCRRFIVDEMVRYDKSYPYLAGLLLRATNNIVNVEIDHKERKIGRSGYSFSKLVGLWVNGFTAFSVKPLRFATVIGLICASVGFIYGVITIINKLWINPQAPMGYSSLMSALVFLGGMILLMLGMIGEYIGRIYISINNSPQAVVRTTINCE